MDRKSLKVGLNQDRPDGVALGEEKLEMGKNEGKANEGEEISDSQTGQPLVSRVKTRNGESSTVGISRKGLLLEKWGKEEGP